PRLVLENRELAKLKGTYVDALPEMVSNRTGRIHPSFHQTGAITGRLSCSDPNLQNIPIRSELGAQIRRAFVPGESGNVLIKADYSQIELRVLAHFSQDKALMAAFAEDRDIHAFVASQLAGIPIDQVTKEQRSRAKTVNFGIVYGQSAFGLSRQTGMSMSEAKDFIASYFDRYPRIQGFLDECIEQAHRHRYVKTMLGRRRPIPDIDSRNASARGAAERLAANTVIQGSAADLIKRAMIHIDRRIIREKRAARMLLQVHDELVFEVPERDVAEEAAMIVEEMSTAIPLEVPVKVDIAAGSNWLDVEEIIAT
ncbi:MAG: DNA polymerase, partial [Phycisphaerae bacterium]